MWQKGLQSPVCGIIKQPGVAIKYPPHKIDTGYEATRMEQRQKESQGERWDKIDHFVSSTPIQNQTPKQSTESKELEQDQHLTKKLQVTAVMKSSSNGKKSSEERGSRSQQSAECASLQKRYAAQLRSMFCYSRFLLFTFNWRIRCVRTQLLVWT